ncbi:PEP-utilizing enzyme [Nonomuraea pusilla]|uniref:PEP-utilizing enzyme n=1 Tax=Nonomuraea pusilla TaxID=46177 RepID=UPI00332E5856
MSEQSPTHTSFPSPYELTAPRGAEGWQELYPYNLVFQEQLREREDAKFWFCDSQHWPNVFKPFETIGVEFAVKCLGQFNTRHYLIPPANGIEFRIHNGYCYMSPVAVPGPEIEARVPEFVRRAGHYFANWDTLLENWRRKVLGTIEEMEAVSFPRLPAVVPFEDIEAGVGLDPTYDLLAGFDRLVQLLYRNWQYHFEFLNLGYVAYLDFFGFCKEVFPDIPDQAIATMVQGVDMELFRPDDEVKRLAKLALDLGLADALREGGDAEETLAGLAGRPGGPAWLEAWHEAHDPWFNFTSGNGFYSADEYWCEHPDIPLGYVRDYLTRLERGETIDRPVGELVEERERIVAEYAELLDDEARETFDAKRALAAQVYPYVENHNFYIEHWTMGVFWRKARELSGMLHAEGFWTRPDDMFYLTREEVRTALFDLATAWGVGAEPIGPSHWPEEIERRRGIVAALESARPQPALNRPPAVISEPFTVMLYGITTEQVAGWLGRTEETEGVLTGMAASPGVAEGPARVISSPRQLSEVREGEVLVAPVTAPSWGPVFGKIKAAVTDIGGMMSHAAIVCREYGLPAVTGTGSASTTISNGTLLRVDGSAGTVTVLDD